ncbi:MAG: hypothetical protein WAV70_21405, partial [Anaerolineae bacterium]
CSWFMSVADGRVRAKVRCVASAAREPGLLSGIAAAVVENSRLAMTSRCMATSSRTPPRLCAERLPG